MLNGPWTLNLGQGEYLFRSDLHGGRDLPALPQVPRWLSARPFGRHATFSLFTREVLGTDRARLGVRQARQVPHTQVEPVVRRRLRCTLLGHEPAGNQRRQQPEKSPHL